MSRPTETDDDIDPSVLTRAERVFFTPSQKPTRRQLLGAGASGALAALAGCSGDGGGDATATATETATETETMGEDATETETATETEVSQEPLEATFAIPSIHLPETQNWQPFHANWPGNTVDLYIHDGTVVYANGDVVFDMTTDWSYDPDEGVKEVTIRDDMTWHNGDPVNIEDYWRELEIRRLFNPEVSDIASHEMVDDYTVRWNWKDDAQTVSNSLMRLNIGGGINTRRDVLKPWHEKLMDAANQEERDSISEEMSNNWRIKTQEWIDKGLGFGPWKMTDFSSERYQAEAWEEHPYIQNDEVTIRQFEQRPHKEAAKLDLMIKNDELDGDWNEIFPAQLEGAAPEYLQTLSRFGFVWMAYSNMNWTGPAAPVLQDRNVRRAFACLMDNNNAVTNNNDRGFVIETQTGMDPGYNEAWLGQDFVDSLIQYPVAQDFDAADEYLAKTDYTRKNGQVVDQDGDQVEFKFISQNKTFRLFTAETVAQQLSDYGFGVDFTTMTWTKMQSIVLGDSGNMEYDLHVNSHYAGINFHPIDYYWPLHMFGHRLAFTKADLQRYYDEGNELSPLNGKPLKPTIPSEVGAEEVSGSGEQLHWYDLWKELKFEADEERSTEIVKKFARYWNYDVPSYDVLQRELGMWGDVKHWNWPEPYGEEESAQEYQLYSNIRHMLKLGQVDYKYEE